MDRLEAVSKDEDNGPHDICVGQSTEVAMHERIVRLYSDLASDPSLSAEDTKPKAKADCLPLTSDSH